MTDREHFALKWLNMDCKFYAARKVDQYVLLVWSDWEEEQGNDKTATFLRWLYENDKYPLLEIDNQYNFLVVEDDDDYADKHFALPQSYFPTWTSLTNIKCQSLTEYIQVLANNFNDKI